MNSRKILLSIFIFSFSSLFFAQNVGDKVYKELEELGENRWCSFTALVEYNEEGKVLLEKYTYLERNYSYYPDGYEILSNNGYVRKYDSKDSVVYEKTAKGSLITYSNDYDKNDLLIHSKASNGFEKWLEYNKNGLLIHYIDTDNIETNYKYDEKNRKVYEKEKTVNGYYEYFYVYDEKGNCSSEEHVCVENGVEKFSYEIFYEYDSNGNIIRRENPGFTNYETLYTYDNNNNLKSSKLINKDGFEYDFYEYDFWDDNKTIKSKRVYTYVEGPTLR